MSWSSLNKSTAARADCDLYRHLDQTGRAAGKLAGAQVSIGTGDAQVAKLPSAETARVRYVLEDPFLTSRSMGRPSGVDVHLRQ